MNIKQLKPYLDDQVEIINRPGFITADPISIPKLFTQKRDIEIMGFFAATFAWGQRVTILNNCKKLIELFENKPYEFIINSTAKDWQRFEGFVHRTFNSSDLLYFIDFFHHYYNNYESLEQLFVKGIGKKDENMEHGLNHFKKSFFERNIHLKRTEKHIPSPAQNSACKRLNMYLRWMVRKDNCGVDFGIWENINPSLLLCPLDVHVGRTARKLGILTRPQDDWKAVIELTSNLKKLDKFDPVKYDFALYGISLFKKVHSSQ
ncbi:MAG: TIGR02757 family protein [Bacteroidota bacterium]|nr:TIGR02757 family protein [Bacteroidota bacterium]